VVVNVVADERTAVCLVDLATEGGVGLLRRKSGVDDRVKVLEGDVREGSDLLVVIPRSLTPDLDGALSGSLSSDTGFNARLESLDDAPAETGRLLGDFEAGRVGRGGGEEGGGGSGGERVSEEERGGEGEEEEETGGRELKGRREEVGVSGVEKTLEGYGIGRKASARETRQE
jgi:hypothetical protein